MLYSKTVLILIILVGTTRIKAGDLIQVGDKDPFKSSIRHQENSRSVVCHSTTTKQQTISEIIPNFDEAKLQQFYKLNVYNLKEFKPYAVCYHKSASSSSSSRYKIIHLGTLLEPYRPVRELQIENLRLAIQVFADESYRLIGITRPWQRSLSPFDNSRYTSVEITRDGYTDIKIQNMPTVLRAVNETTLNFYGFAGIASKLFMQIKNEDGSIYLSAPRLCLTKDGFTVRDTAVEMMQGAKYRAFALSIKSAESKV